VVSLTERLDQPSNTFQAKVNWIHDLTSGYRVTGPMALYNRALYYAASKPPDASGATCNRGSAKVFGVHYIDPKTPTDLDEGPAPLRVAAPIEIDSRSPGMIFGVGIQPDPTCSSVSTLVGGDDSFGYGQVSMPAKSNAGSVYLAYSVSGSTTSSGGSASSTTTETTPGIGDVKTALDSPRAPVSIESFGLLYE
jgi:hypothetical protein